MIIQRRNPEFIFFRVFSIGLGVDLPDEFEVEKVEKMSLKSLRGAILSKRRYLWPILGLIVLLFPFLFFHIHGIHRLETVDAEDQKVKLKARIRGSGRPEPAGSMRMDDDQHYTDLFKDLDEHSEGYTASRYTRPHKNFGAPQCGCGGVGQVSSSVNRAENTTIVQIKKPKRRFHSNHWYHMGEYVLSQHRNAEVTGVVRTGDTIVFIANEVKFVNQLTFASAFFILLALSSSEGCTDGSIRKTRIEFYEPAYVYKRASAPSAEWGSFSSYGPSVILDMSKSDGQQFKRINLLEHVQEEINSGRQCHCGKLISSVGYFPTPSSRWFKTALEINEMKDKMQAFCSTDVHNEAATLSETYPRRSGTNKVEGKVLKMTVFERDSNRHFTDLALILGELDSKLDEKWSISTVRHDEDMQPCELYHELHKTDVFLTTHGFQSTALVFLPEGSVIIEIFPFRYWKASYIPLAAQFGVHHRWAQNEGPTSLSRWPLWFISQEWCMSLNKCRSHARGDSVAMPVDHIDLVIRVAKAKEEGRLGVVPSSFMKDANL